MTDAAPEPTADEIDDRVRIVIAEDEAIIRLDLKESLEDEGYVVVGETARGDEAVELVRTLEPHVVILDIKMPGKDGIEAAREINAERLAAVLLLTAFSQRDLIQQASEAGALAYLVKPFQRSELVPAIELALGRFRDLRAIEGEAAELAGAARDPQAGRPGQGPPHGRAGHDRGRRLPLAATAGDGAAQHHEGRGHRGPRRLSRAVSASR